MNHRAKGTFEVDMQPQPESNAAASGVAAASDATPSGGTTLGRMSLDKVFAGDLAGTGRGQMLTAMTATSGSAGYVAIERVTGTLHERTGSFVLQHSATMTRGAPQLLITVVPDSGTGELTGIAGRLGIDIIDGQHFYAFDYTLPG